MSWLERLTLYLVLFLFGISLGLLGGSYKMGMLSEQKEEVERRLSEVKIKLQYWERKEVKKDEKQSKTGRGNKGTAQGVN